MLHCNEGICRPINTGVNSQRKQQRTKFGDYSLDFELRFCIANADNKLQVESDIYQEIDREFRQSGIEIGPPAVHADLE